MEHVDETLTRGESPGAPAPIILWLRSPCASNHRKQFPHFAKIRGWSLLRSRRLAGRPPRAAGQNGQVNLGRIAWLVAVLACLVTVLILVLEGYYGYAVVTFAVAVA